MSLFIKMLNKHDLISIKSQLHIIFIRKDQGFIALAFFAFMKYFVTFKSLNR